MANNLSRWSQEEDALVRAGKHVPGRTPEAWRTRRVKIGAASPRPAKWTAAEDALVLANQHVPGRTAKASALRCRNLGTGRYRLRAERAGSDRLGTRWTAEEDALVRAFEPVPGRTRESIRSRRKALHATREKGWRGRWSPEEVALAVAYKPVPGRTLQACCHKRAKLGATRIIAPPLPPAALAMLRRFYGRVPTGELAEAIGRRTRHIYDIARRCGLKIGKMGDGYPRTLAIALRDEGRDLVATLQELVPESAAQWDIIQSAAALYLEGVAASLEEAASLARRQHYRENPVLGAPVSLDARAFGDGPTLMERISRGLWDE